MAKLLEVLTGEITESQLYADLGSRIDLIDAPTTGLQAQLEAVNEAIGTINATLADIASTPAYDAGITYAAGDMVAYDGALYQAKSATTGNMPTNAAYWEKVGDYASLGDAVAGYAVILSDHASRVTATENGLTSVIGRAEVLEAAVSNATTGLATKASVTYVDTAKADAISASATSLQQLASTVKAQTLGLPFEQWSIASHTIVTITDGKAGTKALRMANGDTANQGNYVPIDPLKKYRVKFWARPVAATNGLLYFTLQQFTNDTGTTCAINGGREPYKPTGHSRATHNALFGTDAWGEYNSLWSGADFQAGVKFVRPDFLGNYQGTAGYWEVQGFSFVDATDAELNTSAIQTEATTRATQTGELYAQYTVKLDVAGLVSGYGLASTASNAAPASAFGVRANQFFVAPPAVAQSTAPTVNLYDGFCWLDTSVTPNVTRYRSGSTWTTTSPSLPFVIQATPTTINGVSVPAGMYANDAYIKNGTITNAKIGDAAIDNAKIANVSAAKITTGTLDAARIATGSLDAKIANIDAAVIGSGYINAARINTASIANATIGAAQVTGTLTASQINGTNLNVVNGTFSGTLNSATINSGTINLTGDGGAGWGYARSINKWWADGTNGWVFAKNAADGATFAEIKSGSGRIWSSSWDDCGIQFPGISMTNGGLTINQANVINTLNIAGNAVTIPVSAYLTNANVIVTPTLVSVSVAAEGNPIWVHASGRVQTYNSESSDIYPYLYIYVDNALAYTFPISPGGLFSAGFTVLASGTGNRLVQIRGTASGGVATVFTLSFFALVTKR